jgi:hypothetical protein
MSTCTGVQKREKRQKWNKATQVITTHCKVGAVKKQFREEFQALPPREKVALASE